MQVAILTKELVSTWENFSFFIVYRYDVTYNFHSILV